MSKSTGSYIDQTDAHISVGVLGAAWLLSHYAAVKPSTFHSDESAWRIHVEPRWGDRRVGTLKHSEVSAWVAELSSDKSPTTVKRCYGILSAVLDTVVMDKRLSSNPARGVKLPRVNKKPATFLTHRQVDRLADACDRPDVVRFLAYTGLRWGEMAVLTVKSVGTKQRRVSVAVSVTRGTTGTPKTHRLRWVPYPAFLDDALSSACSGKRAGDLVFSAANGGTLGAGNSLDGWFARGVRTVIAEDQAAAEAAREVGEPELPIMPRVTPHDLRHAVASMAISAGANVKVVQRMLGHSSAAMTLDVYSNLFDDDLNSVSEAMNLKRLEALS